MSTIAMTSGGFNPPLPVSLVTVLGDGTTTLERVSVNKHSVPVPNGSITADHTSANVYVDATTFTGLVTCLQNPAKKALISLTYSGGTVTGVTYNCIVK
ncbi:MAG TPA: hypothetical protein VHU80_08110 [Polyangiaceae bacterium]|nr:hypothetical protein [Polyangiaceae bacterium]